MWRNHFGNATRYLYGDGLDVCIVGGKAQPNHTGACVEGLCLVENKVTDAVIDGAAVILFDGLQGVGVVANKEVGTGRNEHSRLLPLLDGGRQLVFDAPMQGNDDVGRGFGAA